MYGKLITYVCEGVDDIWEWNVIVYSRLPARRVNSGSIQGLSVQRWNVQIGIKRAGRNRTESVITYVGRRHMEM
jgi:hypothetical protein